MKQQFKITAVAMSVVGFVCGDARGQLVISQVYSGGGVSLGSPAYQRDYIVIANNGTTAASLNGLSLQYASSNSSSASTVFVLDGAVSLAPKSQYVVVSGTPGSAGAVNPAVSGNQGTMSGNLNLAATVGKVFLARVTTALSFPSGNVNGTTDIIDFVGYGSLSNSSYEGNNGPADAPSSITMSLYRALGSGGIYVDSNDNAADFRAMMAFQPVPEPATVLAASSLALAAVSALRRRRKLAASPAAA